MESRLGSRLEEFIDPAGFNEKAPPGFDMALAKDLKGMRKSSRRLQELFTRLAELNTELDNRSSSPVDETETDGQDTDDFWNHLEN